MKLFRKSVNNSLTKNDGPVFYFLLITLTMLVACRGSEEKTTQTADSLQTFTAAARQRISNLPIDIKASRITWHGSMAFASQGEHEGYAYFSKGELLMMKKQLVGGFFEVDMNTITDPVHGSDNNLIQHLKSDDFFDVAKFPLAQFAVTRVTPADSSNVTITGNLTMKGITQLVVFPATMDVKNNLIEAHGKLVIDRTLWDVRYKSGKFFDDLADEAISDEIEFDIHIVAKDGC